MENGWTWHIYAWFSYYNPYVDGLPIHSGWFRDHKCWIFTLIPTPAVFFEGGVWAPSRQAGSWWKRVLSSAAVKSASWWTKSQWLRQQLLGYIYIYISIFSHIPTVKILIMWLQQWYSPIWDLGMIHTTYLWWFGGWFIIGLTTLSHYLQSFIDTNSYQLMQDKK